MRMAITANSPTQRGILDFKNLQGPSDFLGTLTMYAEGFEGSEVLSGIFSNSLVSINISSNSLKWSKRLVSSMSTKPIDDYRSTDLFQHPHSYLVLITVGVESHDILQSRNSLLPTIKVSHSCHGNIAITEEHPCTMCSIN